MDLFLLWGLQRLSLSVILEPRFKKKGEDRGIIYHELLSTANMKKDKETRALRCELETYRRQGIPLLLNGSPSTPEEIEQACSIAEEGVYMRDYVQNERGEVERLQFDFVKNESAIDVTL